MLCKWKNGGASRLSYANGKMEERAGRSLEKAARSSRETRER